MRECGSPCCVPSRSGSMRVGAAVPSRVREEGRKRRKREKEKRFEVAAGEASKVTAGKGKEESEKRRRMIGRKGGSKGCKGPCCLERSEMCSR
eukprot:2619675-Rhodomonas_salina.1